MTQIKQIFTIFALLLSFYDCSASKSKNDMMAIAALTVLNAGSTVSTLILSETGKQANLVLNQPEDIAVGNDGNLYLTDTSNNRIIKVTSETIVTEVVSALGNGIANAILLAPEGITAGPNNLIYIANTGKHNIISYDTVAGTVSLFSGVAGQSSGDTVDGSLGVGKYFKPEGIRYNSALNKLYVGETGGYNLRVVSTSNGTVTTLAGATGSTTRTAGTPLLSDGLVSVPYNVFNKPKGVVSDSKGNVYIVDKGNHCIRKYDPSTNTLSTFAGSRLGGDTALGYVNATGTSAKFNAPYMITIDENDNLYVADAGNFAIRKITSAGVVTTIAGGNGKGRADGTTASFYNPIGIYYKSSTLYVTDKGSSDISTAASTDYSSIRKIVNF
ncbi:MAG: hypothetical protein EBS19_01685 [Spirochaetia bacterium]|nr:hypothetical protein [Spirochaetia bacterium]